MASTATIVEDSIDRLGPDADPNAVFDIVDTDASNMISRTEFVKVHKHIRKNERELTKARNENRILKWLVVLLFLSVLIVVGVTSGVTASLISAFKDTYVQKDEGADDTEALTDGHGNILGVREQTQAVPLLGAPVLGEAVLRNARTIDATVYDTELETEVRTIHHIAAVSIVNKTAVSFKTMEGDAIYVFNGETYLKKPDGVRLRMCEAKAFCAALHIENAAEADELMDKAMKELVDAGFVAEDMTRRQLEEDCPTGRTADGGGVFKPETKQQLQAAVDEWCGTQPPPPALALKYGDISEWDVSEITDMSNLFRGKYTCDPDLSKWNTGKVTTMEDMFYKAAVFNGDLKKWNTASVVNMKGMFQGASLFRRDLSKWNTGAVTNMFAMFARATTFRGFGLSKWNTGAVTTMAYMFAEADAFKGDLRDWNTGAVTTMEGMFSGATSFNSDLHHWNTDQVTTMEDMFKGAAKFINVEFCPSVPGGVVPPKLGNGVDTCPMPSPSAPPPYWGAFGCPSCASLGCSTCDIFTTCWPFSGCVLPCGSKCARNGIYTCCTHED